MSKNAGLLKLTETARDLEAGEFRSHEIISVDARLRWRRQHCVVRELHTVIRVLSAPQRSKFTYSRRRDKVVAPAPLVV